LLLKQKQEEHKARLARNEISQTVVKGQALEVKALKAYKSEEAYPKSEMQKGKIFVDQKHFAVLFPILETKWLPIHISLIKSASVQTEGQWVYLRVNFAVPGASNLSQNLLTFPPLKGPNGVYIRDFTFKSTDAKYMEKTCKDIKEVIKKFKQKDKER